MRVPSRSNSAAIAAAIVILFSFVYFFAFGQSPAEERAALREEVKRNEEAMKLLTSDMENLAKETHSNRCGIIRTWSAPQKLYHVI